MRWSTKSFILAYVIRCQGQMSILLVEMIIKSHDWQSLPHNQHTKLLPQQLSRILSPRAKLAMIILIYRYLQYVLYVNSLMRVLHRWRNDRIYGLMRSGQHDRAHWARARETARPQSAYEIGTIVVESVAQNRVADMSCICYMQNRDAVGCCSPSMLFHGVTTICTGSERFS